MPIKSKIEKLEDVAEGLRAFYKAEAEGFVLDVEPVAGLALANIAEHEAVTKGIHDRLVQSEADLQTRTSERDKALITQAADAAIRDNMGMIKPLLPHVFHALAVVNGKPVVIGTDGKPQPSKIPGNAEAMTADELVKVLREDKDYWGCFYGKSVSPAIYGSIGAGATRTALY